MKKIVYLICLSICILSCEDNNLITPEKTLIVASKKIDCIGVDNQKCLLIKETETENWQYFYSSIIGFNYDEGFEYVIKVSERRIENPPQDGSSIETTLIEVVSKTEKTSENLPI
ncbi:hypothetical protein BW723_05485 [Polaribacter reichenbachii]|uniref:DUF4377 domain-containing protein n=1 Tax=Polaribacter reichenbachii TaxID=996801 RepID=A0A1B8TUF7_9FLAO|nr:DUF4377 domain-containing protein [Polaribacter reichenbachii]APZ45780.1 hypothetical protein BW723_05485 [Polaribacter reichenbachii]AUC19642.1 hypothetical protein BTO17_13500 [Polaribacter reichenbachii]OBY63202.1 hypothetical protein LPB301_10225 [Polaribacter reichenbachii]